MLNFWLNICDGNKWKQWFSKTYIALIFLFIYVPLVFFILLSFNKVSDKGTISTNLNSWDGGQNYVSFFTNRSFVENMPEALSNSLIIALISTPISVFIGLITAVSIWWSRGKHKSTIFMFSNISISCPDIIQGIAFAILFSAIFIPIGINLGMVTIIITHIVLSVPYVIIFLYPKLSKIKRNMIFVSCDLNYSFAEAIYHVLIPLLFPSLLGAALMVFFISFDDFIITNLIRGSVSTITTELYTMSKGIKAWSSVFGSLVIIITTLFFLVTSSFKIFKEKRDVKASF